MFGEGPRTAIHASTLPPALGPNSGSLGALAEGRSMNLESARDEALELAAAGRVSTKVDS